MIHFGKMPETGELDIRVSADDTAEVYQLLCQAGLQQRRTFHGLRTYLEQEYSREIKPYKQ